MTDPDQVEAAISDGTQDPGERQDSRLLYQALRERKDTLSGQAALPQDTTLSERILADARTRSAQISASRGGSSHRAQAAPRGIPWWMYLLWAAAILAVAAGYHFLV